MTARAVTNTNTSQRLPSTLTAKNVDDAKRSKAQGDLSRIVIGHVSVPAEVDPETRRVLERAAQIRCERAEQRRKRREGPKHPLSFEVREGRREARLRDTEDAYAAINAWSFRPKSTWRDREKWTTADYMEFADRCKKFAAQTKKPSKRQEQLVKSDQNRLRRESFTTDDPAPWETGRQYVRSRLSEGYHGFEGDRVGGNDHYLIDEDFTETYLRSTLSPVIYKFVTGTAAPGSRNRGSGPKLLAGPAKDARKPQWTKLEGLDQEYGSLHPTMRCGWRQEIDRDFESWDALRRHVRKLVNKKRLACMPHVAVAYEDPDTGVIHHPHLWFFLPESHEVLYDRDNTKAHKGCMDLYDGVVCGSFLALQGIGADAGGLANPIDGKFPTCPKWTFQVWNESEFPTLAQWKQCVNVYAKRDDVVREQVIQQSDQPADRSMAAFSDGLSASRDILRAAHKSRDSLYRSLLDDRREMGDWLSNKIDTLLSPKYPEDRSTLRKSARWIAHDWDPKKAAKRDGRNRGVGYAYVRHIKLRDDHGVSLPEGVTERKVVGGRVGRKVLQVKTLDLILSAMEQLAEQGKPRTLANVTALVPQRHPRTVRRNFSIAQADYDAGKLSGVQCLLGGQPATRSIPETSLTAVSQLIQPYDPAYVPDYPVLTAGPGYFEYSSDDRNIEWGHLQLSSQDSHSWAVAQTTPSSSKPSFFGSSVVASCRPPTDDPEHETVSRPIHAGNVDTPSSCPPSPERALSWGPSVDQNGDGPCVQRSLSTVVEAARHPNPSRTSRGDVAGGDRDDHVKPGQRRSYSTCGRRDSSISDDGA